MTITVERFDPAQLSAGELRAIFEFDRAIEEEVEAEGPAPVWEAWRVRVLQQLSWRPKRYWSAFDGVDLVGLFSAELDDSGSNAKLADIFGGVDPARRRTGIARRVYEAMRADLLADGRTLHTFHARDGAEPAESFIGGLGATKRLVERRSRCAVKGLDRAMLASWVGAGEAAADYVVDVFTAPMPEDAVERWAEIQMVMNTAPLDDLEYEDERITTEQVREGEERMAVLGNTNRVLIARHVPTGEWAGFTELSFSPHYPMAAWQYGTAVVPSHRGRGLGRWLKGANALWLLDEKTDVDYIDTWNAFSNAPMLAINDAMGFEVVGAYAAWQLDAA